MAIYCYHRTSTKEQNLDRGIKALTDFVNERNLELHTMFTDKETGKNFDRPDYLALKRIIKKDDILIVKELDRLGRNKELTMKEIRELQEIGVKLVVLEIPTTWKVLDIDNNKNELNDMLLETINNMLIEMYVTFAHAEMQKREQRQREGIDIAKSKGVKFGRTEKKFNGLEEDLQRVINGEIDGGVVRDKYNMTNATYFRRLKKFKDNLKSE